MESQNIKLKFPNISGNTQLSKNVFQKKIEKTKNFNKERNNTKSQKREKRDEENVVLIHVKIIHKTTTTTEVIKKTEKVISFY